MARNVADVVVIGGGHNSLIAAAYLAKAGVEVVVLEERHLIGGNTVTEELTLPGFRHDTCSSAHVLIQSNPAIRDGELDLSSYGLHYVWTDPAVVLPFTDGSSFVVHRDAERTAEEIAKWSDADAQAFLELLADWREGLGSAHIRWNEGDLDPGRSDADARYLTIRTGSALDTLRARFSHPKTLDAMAWLSFATIQRIDRAGTGILPFSIAAGRIAYGWATPLGGSGELPNALARMIEDHGGTVIVGQAVEHILVEHGRASGVRTADGQVWAARRAVLSSAHLTHLPGMLAGTPSAATSVAAASAAWRPGLSLFAVHLALREQVRYSTDRGPLESVAGGLGSVDGSLSQYQLFDRGQWDARDPWLLVVCSTIVDPSRAPDGQGTCKFLTVAPYTLSDGRDWETEKHEFARALLERATRRIDGLADAEVLAVVPESPRDLERLNRHNVGGSCHGGEIVGSDGEVLMGWPSHRLPVPGLYLTGSTSHPGGSVAGRAGRRAAQVLLSDLGIDPATVMAIR